MYNPMLIAEPVQEDIEAVSRLCKLPPGPFRSLGGYLDYSGWADRDRFLELDRALKVRRQLEAMRDAAREATCLASAA